MTIESDTHHSAPEEPEEAPAEEAPAEEPAPESEEDEAE